jgi:glucosylceramidase
MEMSAESQHWFIDAHLGPTLRNAGYGTKIIGYDHNCDVTDYPIRVAESSYVDGSAFHLYGGDISAMTTVYSQTGKNVYFTEQYTDIDGTFSGDFSWHMQNIMIGSMNNWSKMALEWNLATDANYGPKTPGGCSHCQGAITITDANNYTREVSYYIIAQFSKFVNAGAVRIGSADADGAIHQVAFQNPDGSYVVVVYNNGGGKEISIGIEGKSFTAFADGYSAKTFVWGGTTSTTGPVTVYNDCPFQGNSGGLDVGNYTQADLLGLSVNDNTVSSIQVAEGYKAILFENDNFGGASIDITADDDCLTDLGWNDRATSIQVVSNGDASITGRFYLENRESGLLMDVAGGTGSIENGANVQQWNKAYTDNQLFEFIHQGDGSYVLIATHSQKALDVQDASPDNGGNIHQWENFSAHNQQFVAVPTGDGYYKLVAKHSAKIVEVAGASLTPEANVQQWENNNQYCGQWKLLPETITNTAFNLYDSGTLIYPNPVQDRIIFRRIYGTMGGTIVVYNTMGQKVKTVKQNSFDPINVADLSPGVYLLEWTNGSQKSIERFTKQ